MSFLIGVQAEPPALPEVGLDGGQRGVGIAQACLEEASSLCAFQPVETGRLFCVPRNWPTVAGWGLWFGIHCPILNAFHPRDSAELADLIYRFELKEPHLTASQPVVWKGRSRDGRPFGKKPPSSTLSPSSSLPALLWELPQSSQKNGERKRLLPKASQVFLF